MQVLDHAETVKQLSQQEALVTELQQQQAAHEASGQAAHKAKVCLLTEMVMKTANRPKRQIGKWVVTVNRGAPFVIGEGQQQGSFSCQPQQHHVSFAGILTESMRLSMPAK